MREVFRENGRRFVQLSSGVDVLTLGIIYEPLRLRTANENPCHVQDDERLMTTLKEFIQ
jgi:hypothetical protein